MRVLLVAHTVVTGWGHMRDVGWVDHQRERGDEYDISDEPWIDSDYLAEFAGRLCYQSWERPNPATATNDGYLANILYQRHFSVLEHASATFYVDGVSRSLTHELVRHRHLSFSQVSQRYVDESTAELILPPLARDNMAPYGDPDELIRESFEEAKDLYAFLVDTFTKRGVARKQARQAARCVLPNATETKILVTGNLRAWRDVIEKRISPHADEEIQQLATEVLRQLKEIAPNTFQDFL